MPPKKQKEIYEKKERKKEVRKENRKPGREKERKFKLTRQT